MCDTKKRANVYSIMCNHIVKEQILQNTCLVCFLTNKRLVEVTNQHRHLQQCIHCITAITLLYVVLPVCIFWVKKWFYHYTPNILKITISKWPRLDQLDNRSYSKVQLTTFTTYNMKIEVGPALILELFDSFESTIDPDYTPKFSPNL